MIRAASSAALAALSAGYAGPPPLTVWRLVSGFAWEPTLAAGCGAAAVAYLAGLRTLRRRGDAWPVGRTLAFFGGLFLVAYAGLGGLAVYDDTLFSAHMAQHMILNMVAPVPLALGAPVTLALRTIPARSRWRRGLLAVLHSRFARVVAFPPVGFALFTASTFALYFSPWYESSLDHPWLHALVHVHFLTVGCLFFWPILGIDPLPGRLPYWGRLMTLFLAMPFHAFLGLAIMSDSSVIAGAYYRALARPWGSSLLGDQHTGGALLWSSGDLVAIGLFGALFVQWSRAETRLAEREDRRLDRLDAAAERALGAGGAPPVTDADAELAAYNARLAALHGQ